MYIKFSMIIQGRTHLVMNFESSPAPKVPPYRQYRPANQKIPATLWKCCEPNINLPDPNMTTFPYLSGKNCPL
jgi:hypothetical protein